MIPLSLLSVADPGDPGGDTLGVRIVVEIAPLCTGHCGGPPHGGGEAFWLWLLLRLVVVIGGLFTVLPMLRRR